MDPVICPACSTANPAGFRFCGSCGNALEVACPNCGTLSPAGFRFCGACGTALPGMPPEAAARPAAPAAERKLVTALFADLTASTELASSLDPEDLRAILRPFFEAMRHEIERFGGTVEKYIGDAVVAVFGAPVSHEDDPERALRAALAMQKRLAALSLDLGRDLRMRIGVNTGEVVTVPGAEREGLVTGEVMNVAARLQALAEPGTVVAADRTYRDARRVIEFACLGDVMLKGIDRPVTAWQVVDERAARGEPGRKSPLIGRDDELELLRLLFARTARERKANLATLLGPAGIGKSRLSHEIAVRIEREAGDLRVVRGRCLPYGDGLTYWPLAEILKADAGVLDSDPPEEIIGKIAGTGRYEAGMTEVQLASIGMPVRPDPLSGAEASIAKESITRAWLGYFEALASSVPVLALIEDLHWADESLLDVLESLTSRVNAPVLFVCMARADLLERRPGWGGGHRSATTITLSPLSDRDCETMVRHLLGGRPAPDTAVSAILSRAEGNPFFAGELLRMIIEDGTLVAAGDEWKLERPLPVALPDTVQGVLASRIDMLPPEEKRVIQDAAVVGRIFWQGLVEELGAPGSDVALRALIERSLVFERDRSVIEGERELIFNHILTRDVAYGSIPKARRAPAHRQAGAWIEQKTAGRALEHAEILAYHFEQAGDIPKTAQYALLSGHRSLRVYAAEEAIRWYDRALAAAREDPDAVGDDLVAEASLSRGSARELLGLFPDANADYELALGAARAAGDGHLEARALAARAHILWLQDRYEDGRKVLPEALDKAREVGASDVLSHLLYTAGTIAFGRGEFREALAMHREALRVAQENADIQGEAFARHGLCETFAFLGPLQNGLTEALRARELFRDIGNRPELYHNEYMIGYLNMGIGHFDDALRAFEEALAGTRELGAKRDQGFSMVGPAILHLVRSSLGPALDAFDAVVAFCEELPTPRLQLVTRAYRVDVLFEIGAIDVAETDVRRARAISDRMGGTWYRGRVIASQGALAVAAGHPDEARALFAEARGINAGNLFDALWSGQTEVEAWSATTDTASLRSAAQDLRDRAAGESGWWEAWGTYGVGLAAFIEGDYTEAEKLAAGARDAAARWTHALVQWRAAGLRARALRALGRHDEAIGPLSEATSLIEAAAASLADERLRASFLARPIVTAILDEARQ